jgi:hypothetical protein
VFAYVRAIEQHVTLHIRINPCHYLDPAFMSLFHGAEAFHWMSHDVFMINQSMMLIAQEHQIGNISFELL